MEHSGDAETVGATGLRVPRPVSGAILSSCSQRRIRPGEPRRGIFPSFPPPGILPTSWSTRATPKPSARRASGCRARCPGPSFPRVPSGAFGPVSPGVASSHPSHLLEHSGRSPYRGSGPCKHRGRSPWRGLAALSLACFRVYVSRLAMSGKY